MLDPSFDLAAALPLLGSSPPIKSLRALIARVARWPVPVRIEGESGTGKTVVARMLHAQGAHPDGPFVECAIPLLDPGLMLGQLVGYARGAYTGALRDAPGMFERAHGGTLFLDEIGEATPEVQRALLTLIEARAVTRLGEERPRHVHVRLVLATNRQLTQEAGSGTFRSDLLYRISGVRLTVPPLRERREDLAAILPCLLDRLEPVVGALELDAATLARIQGYAWPGNFRELEHALVHLAAHGVLPAEVRSGETRAGTDLLRALEANGGNVSRTARQAGVSRPTVYRAQREAGV